MADRIPGADAEVPPVSRRLSPMQSVVWNVAGAGEIVGICGFISDRADMGDPFVVIVAVVSSLTVVWFTRKWILSRWPDERLRAFGRRRP